MTVVSFNMAYRSFRGGFGRLDTRLDTPPSINRRHPDSCLARFQDFESEHAGLPGKYARPEGVVLVGRTADEAVGIAAYRPFEHRICEMKRLYVLPRFRGTGLGRLLVEELVRDARSHGYRRMVLDTLPSMRPAQALYSAMGFRPIRAYYDNPLPRVIYMALEL